MTNGELAEEYASKNVPIDTFGYRSLDDVHYDVRQAFLAGLKAGRPKWHDLMEDPNDLPAKRQHILCYTSDPWCHNYKGLKNVKHCDVEMGTYMGNGEWYIGCYHTCVPPKAWCEIPKFEE